MLAIMLLLAVGSHFRLDGQLQLVFKAASRRVVAGQAHDVPVGSRCSSGLPGHRDGSLRCLNCCATQEVMATTVGVLIAAAAAADVVISVQLGSGR